MSIYQVDMPLQMTCTYGSYFKPDVLSRRARVWITRLICDYIPVGDKRVKEVKLTDIRRPLSRTRSNGKLLHHEC